MPKLRICLATAAAVAVACTLTACGTGAEDDDSTSTSDTLVVDTAFSLNTIDPARMFEPTGNLIDHALYDTLLTFEGGDMTAPVPSLASSYTRSPDGKTYRFELRTDAVFSDGTPVTSADVVFSLNRVKNILGNPSFLMAGITVTAPDEDTVVLTSETPNAAIPFIVPNPSLGIVNSKAVMEEGGDSEPGADTSDTAESALNAESQGSGPYLLESFSTTSEVVLTVNPTYWGPKPHYSRVVIRNVQASVQRLNVVKGESQIAVDLSPAQADGATGVQVIGGASPNVVYLVANASPTISSVASNPDFQEAVRYGLDYEGLLEVAGNGAVQAAGVIPSMFIGSLSASDAIQRDVARARAALDRSALTNPTVKLAYPSDLQVNGLNFGDLATRIQQDLKEVGITVELAPAPTQVALDAYRAGKQELGLWYWGPDFPDPSDYLVFLPNGALGVRANWLEGADPALEAMGAEAAQTTDAETRQSLFEEIQEALNTTSPFTPLIQPAQILVAADSVKNLQSNAVWLVSLSELG